MVRFIHDDINPVLTHLRVLWAACLRYGTALTLRAHPGVFLQWNSAMCTFVLFFPERFPASRVMYSAGQIACGENAMAHRNALDFDAAHNSAIRKEIGYWLRAQLSRGEQTSPPPRVQDLLDRLTALDDTKGGTKSSDDDSQH
jgi:hypothetical protein